MALRDELVNVLQQRVGLDQQKSQQAVDAIMDYLKQNAPEPVRQYLEGGMSKGLGGIFGS